jgi:hypothetical protein
MSGTRTQPLDPAFRRGVDAFAEGQGNIQKGECRDASFDTDDAFIIFRIIFESDTILV